jgi:hypothetical protein
MEPSCQADSHRSCFIDKFGEPNAPLMQANLPFRNMVDTFVISGSRLAIGLTGEQAVMSAQGNQRHGDICA